ncbi:MAG: methyltransferase [Prevotella sp.]|nr:methyltransferase [Prevotella sp.]
MPNDYFQFKQFTVHQGLCAMKVGTDGTLLGAWANVVGHASQRADGSEDTGTLGSVPYYSILDIGTGTGLIALMMAQRYPQAQVTAIDIDPQAVQQARENVAASPFADRITIIEGDIRRLSLPPFDTIVCNPPYFDASLESPDAQRTLARHTSSLSYRELMTCAWRLLGESGELSVVIPFDCKSRLEAEAILTGFHLTRSCAVRTTPTKLPRRFLLAFQKHPTPLQTEELVIGSDAYNELTKDFYLV